MNIFNITTSGDASFFSFNSSAQTVAGNRVIDFDLEILRYEPIIFVEFFTIVFVFTLLLIKISGLICNYEN